VHVDDGADRLAADQVPGEVRRGQRGDGEVVVMVKFAVAGVVMVKLW